MKVILILASLLALSLANSDFEQWKEYKSKFDKFYDRPLEEQTRYDIFTQNLRRIEAHNAKFEAGEVTWTMAVNQFADLTDAEFEDLYLSPVDDEELLSVIEGGKMFTEDSFANIPDSIDWREKGAVGPIKNQGTCGSCWTFSSLGSLEGVYFVASGNLVDLSEQNVLDCADSHYHGRGCGGGVMPFVYLYIRDNGIMYDKDYPYKGINGTCEYDETKIAEGFTVDTYALVKKEEESIKSVVANKGPVGISIRYTSELHRFYNGGIFDSEKCVGKVNHGVVLVGYGTENNTDYWIVKNSYGDTWGENGFFRMTRGNNMCNVTYLPTFPMLGSW